MYRLVDMHCHLDRMTNATNVAMDAATRSVAIFDTTVTPTDALAAQLRFEAAPNVRVGAGLHPWWIADGRCGEDDVTQTAHLAATSPYVGEIGLDLSKRYASTETVQTHALRTIVERAACHPLPHRVFSVHAVRSVTPVLDIFEELGLLGADAPAGTTVIIHWFSGSSDELTRARRLGCAFSINEHTLATKRGRAYAQAIPRNQLLLETDAPPGLDAPYTARELEASLMRTLATLAELRREDSRVLAETIAHTSEQLLQL